MDRFFSDRRGGVALEYVSIASLIGIVLVAALSAIGVDLQGMFEAASNGFTQGGP